MAAAVLTSAGGRISREIRARKSLDFRLLGLLMLATPAVAEGMPVLGLWGGPDCLRPVEIGAGRVTQEGAACEVSAIVALGDTGAWAFRMDCAGEVRDMVVMHDRQNDRLWLWQDAEATAPRLMTRCGG